MTTEFRLTAEEMAWKSFAESQAQQGNIHFQGACAVFMSVTEAAEEFGVPPETLRWACREGWIVSEKRYGRWRFTRQALLNWMAEPQKTGRPRKWKGM